MLELFWRLICLNFLLCSFSPCSFLPPSLVPRLSCRPLVTPTDSQLSHYPHSPTLRFFFKTDFGGIQAVLPEPDADGNYPIPIIAPLGFMEHAVSENVLAGNAMVRRAMYMYGEMLTNSEVSQVDCGLGKTTSKGRITLVEPNVVIKGDNGRGEETMVVDGVEIVFYLVGVLEGENLVIGREKC